MKRIKIGDIEGWYYVEDDTLIYSCDDTDDVEVSDLTELKVWQYDRLVIELSKHYPNYKIKYLTGRFI